MAVDKKTWQPLPHKTVETAFETLLLKSARSKWAQIDQHTKALRLSHRAYFFALFFFRACTHAPN
jgi:hypothetical protein